MMMNGMGTGTGSTIIAGYRLADWATGLVLLLLSILIVALLGGFLGVVVDFVRSRVSKNTPPPADRNSAEGNK